MKIKNLLFGFITLSIFLTSCSKDETTDNLLLTKTSETKTVVSLNGTTTSQPLKAYIFIEPKSKHPLINGYLKALPSLVAGKRQFPGFQGVNGDSWKYNLPNYISMPFWSDGRLPQIIESEIPQTSGGVDAYGNPIQAYNFKTVKIAKNTVNDKFSWVVVLIPINAMSNDTKRQRRIHVVEKLNTTIKSSTVYTTDNVISGTIINYQGNRIPAGQYRVYSTYPSTGMRMNLNSTYDVYIRGLSNN